jgi:F-type H+-transporting ATPase subunit epsilon
MSSLRVLVSTPTELLLDAAEIEEVRAEDASGSFGILPGHTDLITALPPTSVVRWRSRASGLAFCVIRGGVLTVESGRQVAIACRQGTVGSDLAALEASVARMRHEEHEAHARARVEEVRLHAQAIRHLVRYLRGSANGSGHLTLGES